MVRPGHWRSERLIGSNGRYLARGSIVILPAPAAPPTAPVSHCPLVEFGWSTAAGQPRQIRRPPAGAGVPLPPGRIRREQTRRQAASDPAAAAKSQSRNEEARSRGGAEAFVSGQIHDRQLRQNGQDRDRLYPALLQRRVDKKQPGDPGEE